MFDIGFTEILLVLVVALIVIGPERMPEVARKIGQFIGKTKRFINSVKEDSEISSAVRELHDSINLDEEKKAIESVSDSLHDDFSQLQQDWEVEEISRPTFGGSEPVTSTESQFNKAPQQPVLPSAEPDKTATKPAATDKAASEEKAVKTDTPAEKEPAPQQEKA
ncbi:Sec-independent protein translocase protein TatB [Hydrogenovibrio sp. JE_KL2]|jgi:sec-independent protein translocase protein TatB|uniref:Sec-independent protein translocase protein TatB n=1 Tax=Hydrogenovibrio sp. JE_KL2 TaxID=2651188 RepID=UPI00128BA039|nr:Sec-independent protein translocase protein TatB [Hydrogenovibrio sp. JE_KL2]MBN2607344.1 twin-arginine translocase subunit TatB [Thiotrichales bacterium]MPQ76299.1 twin-arginine translocase subunit TatB [Hydrogenovibrio sp. JE_KL2]